MAVSYNAAMWKLDAARLASMGVSITMTHLKTTKVNL